MFPHPEGGLGMEGGSVSGMGRPGSFHVLFPIPVIIAISSWLVENEACGSHSLYTIFHVKASLGSVTIREIRACKSLKRAEVSGKHISTFIPHVTPPGQVFSTHGLEEVLPHLSCACSAVILSCRRCSHSTSQHCLERAGCTESHHPVCSQRQKDVLFKSVFWPQFPSKNK